MLKVLLISIHFHFSISHHLNKTRLIIKLIIILAVSFHFIHCIQTNLYHIHSVNKHFLFYPHLAIFDLANSLFNSELIKDHKIQNNE